MKEYHGIVQSIIERGPDVYQVTVELHPQKNAQKPTSGRSGTQPGNFFVHRVDIVIEGDRTIVYPDRDLDRCMDIFFDFDEQDSRTLGLEDEWSIGRTVGRICNEVGEYLLERAHVEFVEA